MTGRTKTAVARATALAITGLWLGSLPLLAQESAEGNVEQRLDRIEQKLDRIIKHLNEQGEQRGSGAAGTVIPPAPASETNTDIPPPGVADPEPFKAGAVAIARAAPERPNALPDIPPDGVGSFVYAGGAIPLNDLSRTGVRYTGVAAVELQGWLKVTEPGRTQIGVEYRVTTGFNVFTNPTCIASIWLEDRSIGSKRAEIPMPAREEKTASVILGADLQPGLYRMRAWLACTPPRDLHKLNAELLIKTPSDKNLRMIDDKDLLHQGG